MESTCYCYPEWWSLLWDCYYWGLPISGVVIAIVLCVNLRKDPYPTRRDYIEAFTGWVLLTVTWPVIAFFVIGFFAYGLGEHIDSLTTKVTNWTEKFLGWIKNRFSS